MGHHRSRLEDAVFTRREFLCRCGMGMGTLGFAALLQETTGSTGVSLSQSINPLSPRFPHFAGKAKRVIHIFLNGGPSHVDTFDPKPALEKYAGKPLPI